MKRLFSAQPWLGPAVFVVVMLLGIGVANAVLRDSSQESVLVSQQEAKSVPEEATTSSIEASTDPTSAQPNESTPTAPQPGTAPAPTSADIQIAPDGAVLEGSDAPQFDDNDVVITSESTTTASGETDDDQSELTQSSTTQAEADNQLPPLDRAEIFAAEYFTVSEGETVNQWRARLLPHVTEPLAQALNFPEFDEGVANQASVVPSNEIDGELNDDNARIAVVVYVTQTVDGVIRANQSLVLNVVLIRVGETNWLVADLYLGNT